MSTISYIIAVNGKLKFNIELENDLTEQEIESAVMDNFQYKKAVGGCTPKKCIILKCKLVNFVV